MSGMFFGAANHYGQGLGPKPLESKLTCACCGRTLTEIVSLEFDQRINEYHDFGVPSEYSQGWFDFGPDCAKKARAKARAALSKAEGGRE